MIPSPTVPPDSIGQVQLGSELFHALFPFHLVFAGDGCLRQAGRSLARVSSSFAVGAYFAELFAVRRPEGSDWDWIRCHPGVLFLLHHRATGLPIRGHFVAVPGGDDGVLFLGSPWITSTQELESYRLLLSDFALHDPTVDLIQVMQSQQMALVDLQALADRLGAQRAELRETNRRMNEQFRSLQQAQHLLRLQEAEARKLSMVASWTRSSVIICDADRRIEWVNEGFTRLTGYALADVAGKKPRDILQGAATDLDVVRHIGEQLRRVEPVTAELLNYSRTGDEYWIALEIQPVFDADGQLTNFIGIQTDITARKRAEQALRRSVENLGLVARLAAHFINIDPAATDGEINQYLGVIGRHAGVDRALVALVAADGARFDQSHLWQADGLADADPWQADAVATPWLHGLLQERQVFTLAAIADVPEEAALDRAFFGGRPTASAALVPLFSAGQLLGWVGLETVREGRAWTADDLAVLQLSAATFAAGLKRREALDALRAANESLEQRVVERTRQLQETQAQLYLGEKLASVGQLAAGVAHEINNPLSFVYTNFNALRERFAAIDQVLGAHQRVLGRLDASGDGGAELQSLRALEAELDLEYLRGDMGELFAESADGFARINSILTSMRDLSRVDHGDQLRRCDLNRLLHDTLVIARKTLSQHAEVETDLGVVPEVLCMPGQLNQVFLNLLINAAQAVAESSAAQRGRICVRTWQAGAYACCSVSDSGRGVAEALRTRIFEPFFTTKPPGHGTGLGLSISYDIVVKRHQGRLSLDSQAGHGATFVVEVPIDGPGAARSDPAV
jgi:PAS domain S-box-containing protein